jgi:NADH-quinone oxidoreductase subunit M
MFPEATVDAMPTIMVLSLIGIIYGALVAMVQPDAKRLVAYSSVAHMGFVMIGLFALNMQGLQGGMLQMVNHGLSTGALFICVGILYDRRHTRMIADFGGISKVMPVFATLFLIVTLSSIGLPGLNGFIGEFLSMLGAFQAHWIYGVVASIGVILAAVYMLWMFQRVMYGEITHEENEKLSDINTRELICLLPILFFIVWIGVYPGTFLEKMEPSIQHLLEQVEPVVEEHRPDHDFGMPGTEMSMEMNMNEAEAGDGHGEE